MNVLDQINNLDSNIFVVFYTTVAMILAGVVAILFSFSLFSVQHAAANYAPNLIDEYKKDARVKRTLYFFAVVILLNMLFVFLQEIRGIRYILSAVSFITIVASLIVAKLQYDYAIDLVNPMRLVDRCATQVRHTIKELSLHLDHADQPPGEPGRRVFEGLEVILDLFQQAGSRHDYILCRHALLKGLSPILGNTK
jgi:vacuolar-type H+-ATPase subunit I/STV1